MQYPRQSLPFAGIMLHNNAAQCHVHIILHYPASAPHILYSLPWKGLHTPLTLSFKVRTGFVTFFSFSPLALRSSSALLKISCGSIFRTQMAFSRPLMYWPLMTGCLCGRGETVISMLGFSAANAASLVLRKSLYIHIRQERWEER